MLPFTQLNPVLKELADEREKIFSTYDDILERVSDLLTTLQKTGLVDDQDIDIPIGDPLVAFNKQKELVREQLDLLEELGETYETKKRRMEKIREELATVGNRLLDWTKGLFGGGPPLANELEELQEEIEKHKAKQEKIERNVVKLARKAAGCRKALLEQLRDSLTVQARRAEERLHMFPLPLVGSWKDPRWESWPLNQSTNGKFMLDSILSPYLYAGRTQQRPETIAAVHLSAQELMEAYGDLGSLSIPRTVPFIGEKKTLIVKCTQATEADGLNLIHAFVLRIAALLGPQVRFTLLDPFGQGMSFPMQRFLPTRKTSGDVVGDLQQIVQDIRRINTEVLDTEEGLHKLSGPALAAERFEIVVAAVFPKNYDRRAVETLFSIANVGQRAGRYVILHHVTDYAMPREMTIESIDNRYEIEPTAKITEDGLLFIPDATPTKERRDYVLEQINTLGQRKHAIDWELVVGLPESQWWQEKSVRGISTPIGLRGAEQKEEIWFGVRNDAPCVHGILAGMPGSGKSTLYHGLILGLAIRYSPRDLQMYLVDGKFGTEFQTYKQLPHAAVVSLKTQPDVCRSVLQELYREMDRRNGLFQRENVKDFVDFREKAGKDLPRILLLIDEYQQLFEDDHEGVASDLLRKLATQGRSAGIHMLLGSQQYGAPGMLHRKDIFDNIHLKMAMKMQPDAIQGLTEFGPIGKRMIRDCDLPGKFVFNLTGRDEETIAAQAANLESDLRLKHLRDLRRKGKEKDMEDPKVLVGDEQPNLFSNESLLALFKMRAWLSEKELEAIARREEGVKHGCGLGQPTWIVADKPIGLCLGKQFNVNGHTYLILRRGLAQNALLVGSDERSRAGMVAGMLIGLAALHSPADVVIDILNATPTDDSPQRVVVNHIVQNMLKPAGFRVFVHTKHEELEPMLDELVAEIPLRAAEPGRKYPTRLLFLIEPDRLLELRRSDLPGKGANPRGKSCANS